MTDQQAIDEGYMEGQKSFEYLVKNILENFNFKRVYDVMKLLDWGWHIPEKDCLYIPTVEALKRAAYQHLKEAFDQKRTISTGGFTYGFDDGHLFLDFTIEAWHSAE